MPSTIGLFRMNGPARRWIDPRGYAELHVRDASTTSAMVLMALSGTLSPVAHVLPAIDLAGRAVMERVFCLS
jgi:hypothetical protein